MFESNIPVNLISLMAGGDIAIGSRSTDTYSHYYKFQFVVALLPQKLKSVARLD
jgi:hypothetical protein